MNYKALILLRYAIIGISLSLALSSIALAQPLPGPADAGRVKPGDPMFLPNHSQDKNTALPTYTPIVPIPKGAKNLHFTLNSVSIEGATAFTQMQMADIYTQYLHKEITLDVAYVITGMITERYRNAGYFLSRAYVPAQKIDNGIITIKVVEGYVGKVDLPDTIGDHRVIHSYIDRLIAARPLKSQAIESFLLRLNDLPGYNFSGVLSPLDGAEDGAVKLTLVPIIKEARGSLTFDNVSSRFLGPNELSASYTANILPLQQTTLSVLSGLPTDKLRYGTLDHTVMIAPDITLEVNGSITKAYPGYSLERFDIDSLAMSEGLSLNYQWLRQRQENLSLKLTFDSRDVTSNILHAALTRDHIRALRAGANYDMSDSWHGHNIANITVSQGMNGLGSSQRNDLNLSRAGAIPDFTKAELSLSRLQGITNNWSLLASISGQYTSSVLYSSEQFGYGGQAYGRAYDSSDITGDKGMAGSLELRYGGLSRWKSVTPQPYVFYDVGEIWNNGRGQSKNESGASAGVGVRFNTLWHQTGNLGLAWPLTRDITAPIYGSGRNGPRILLQIGLEF